MDVYSRLEELEIELPEPVRPVGSYTALLRTGNLLYLSGILPFYRGRLLYEGRVPEKVSLEEAQKASRQIVLNALSLLHAEVGLNSINQCVRLNGYVASSEDFYDQPRVLNSASELLKDVFGKRGVHTRVAVGVYVLPLNSPVEIDFVFELKT